MANSKKTSFAPHRSAILWRKCRSSLYRRTIWLSYLAFTASVAETPKRLGFEEISSFPKFLEREMGCSGIFPLGAFFFALLGCATPRGEVEGVPACVWGFWGVVCLWEFGAGCWARGACGGLVRRVEGGGFDFFLPKKGPTGPESAGPAGSRRDHAGAKARPPPRAEGDPRRRLSRTGPARDEL